MLSPTKSAHLLAISTYKCTLSPVPRRTVHSSSLLSLFSGFQTENRRERENSAGTFVACCGLYSTLYFLHVHPNANPRSKLSQKTPKKGMSTVVTSAVVRDIFSFDDRTRVMGILGVVRPMAIACSPIIGGYLSQKFSWKMVYIFTATFGFFVFVFALLKLPESRNLFVKLRTKRGLVSDFVGDAFVTQVDLMERDDPFERMNDQLKKRQEQTVARRFVVCFVYCVRCTCVRWIVRSVHGSSVGGGGQTPGRGVFCVVFCRTLFVYGRLCTVHTRCVE